MCAGAATQLVNDHQRALRGRGHDLARFLKLHHEGTASPENLIFCTHPGITVGKADWLVAFIQHYAAPIIVLFSTDWPLLHVTYYYSPPIDQFYIHDTAILHRCVPSRSVLHTAILHQLISPTYHNSPPIDQFYIPLFSTNWSAWHTAILHWLIRFTCQCSLIDHFYIVLFSTDWSLLYSAPLIDHFYIVLLSTDWSLLYSAAFHRLIAFI